MSISYGKIYFVGGVNGVGKSSFLRELSFRYPRFELFRGSEKFMEWLGLKPGDYQKLRSLSDAYKDTELNKMMRQVLQKGGPEGKTLIVDAHYLNYKEGNVVDATGEWMVILDALFVVSASPQIILKRLENDEKVGRDRNLLPNGVSRIEKIRLIDKFLKLTLKKAQEISQRYQIPYFVIDNNDNDLTRAVNEFLRYDSIIIRILRNKVRKKVKT